VDALVTDRTELGGIEARDVYHLPLTPNGRGVADAWSAASDGEPADVAPRLVLACGDEAALDPGVRALAEHAETVVGIGLFQESFRGFADVVLPGTSYLEREGTYVNLEGRLQRLRRTAMPPGPDELEWLAQLASRFGVELAPYASSVFAEISERCYGGLPFGEVGERAPLRGYREAPPHVEAPPLPEPAEPSKGLNLVSYKPLFSGPAVERVSELQFQRPQPEIELSRADARELGIGNGDLVEVSVNGTSVELRAALSNSLRPGIARVAEEHSAGLSGRVSLALSTPKAVKAP
jgi:anaerobic selenocysteine-containing dehydrogenase